VAIRSTAWPGTAESIYTEAFNSSPLVRMVSNPEFLREGCAVRDFLEPSLLVVGGCDPAAAEAVARLYAPLPVAPCLVSLRTAEMIKYACNAFHAVKVCFANEIGALCDRLAIPAREVMDTLCRDEKLNVSRAYLKPGFAFGGSCLPKDLRALAYRASRLDVDLPLLTAALPSNERHLRRAIDAVMDLPAARIGVAGLTFKEDTDDLRESPVVGLLEYLLGKGREVRVYDRNVRLDVIYGSNRHFLLNAIPHIGRLLESSVDGLLAWADHVVVTQPLDGETAARIAASGRPVLDLARSGAFPGAGL
jgi:GDP-mannose 6-dehydrogenase